MAISNDGNSYQKGTTAAAINARRVLSVVSPQIQGAVNEPAFLVTAIAGNNNDLTYTAKTKGTIGNSITVAYVVAGNNTALSVSVSSSAITVNVATDGGGAATSTAAQVAAAIAASVPAAALVTVANATGNDGTGVVAALTATALANGKDQTAGGVSNLPLPTIPPIHYRYA